jgi:hypothetical protein
MNFRAAHLPALLALATALPAFGAEPLVALRPHHPAPGESVLVRTSTSSHDGTITVREGTKQRSGTIEISRNRTIERSITGTGKKEKLTLRILDDEVTTTTRLAGSPAKTERKTGPLAGLTATGMRDATKRWRIFLDNGTADTGKSAAISALEAYENRRWFPPRPVNAGATWPIDPAFIRHIVSRDLGKSPIDATMTLREIRKNPDGTPATAVIDCKIHTKGRRPENAGAPATGAVVALAGTLEIDLATMLDTSLVLEGTLATYASDNETTTTINVPLRMQVSKSIRRAPGIR